MTILDEIADYARERVKLAKSSKSLEAVKAEALSLHKDSDFKFERSLRESSGLAFIC